MQWNQPVELEEEGTKCIINPIRSLEGKGNQTKGIMKDASNTEKTRSFFIIKTLERFKALRKGLRRDKEFILQMLLGWKGKKKEELVTERHMEVISTYSSLVLLLKLTLNLAKGHGLQRLKWNMFKSEKVFGISYTCLPTRQTDLLASHIYTDQIRKVNFDCSDKPLCITISRHSFYLSRARHTRLWPHLMAEACSQAY